MSDYELNIALKESERNESEDAYFKARPISDTQHSRQMFRDGFDRAWDVLHTGRKTNGKLLPPAPFVQMD